ncbi:hypothetical protein CEXT_800891 [Caerostris extrusa]|uniref:Uncharacterized protein n=1 Tax=Caerostris extrusa TaxID=172846 RepID=A0AAV4MBW8_CAEEX|nr:hypothetical protein CEXT_800891 [Caerostris extrusa]
MSIRSFKRKTFPIPVTKSFLPTVKSFLAYQRWRIHTPIVNVDKIFSTVDVSNTRYHVISANCKIFPHLSKMAAWATSLMFQPPRITWELNLPPVDFPRCERNVCSGSGCIRRKMLHQIAPD